jgi:hypothetical protein
MEAIPITINKKYWCGRKNKKEDMSGDKGLYVRTLGSHK